MAPIEDVKRQYDGQNPASNHHIVLRVGTLPWVWVNHNPEDWQRVITD